MTDVGNEKINQIQLGCNRNWKTVQIRSELFSSQMHIDYDWYNFVSFLFLPMLLCVTVSFHVWVISVGLNWNRKYGFSGYFTFNGACLKVSWLVWRLMHFKSLWPSPWFKSACYIWPGAPQQRYIRLWIRNSQKAGSLCLVREKVDWRVEVNEVWVEKKSYRTCDFAGFCKETWEGKSCTSLSLSPYPYSKWLRLSLFPSASGHGLSVMTLSISPERQSVSRWLSLLLPCFSSLLVWGTETNLGL